MAFVLEPESQPQTWARCVRRGDAAASCDSLRGAGRCGTDIPAVLLSAHCGAKRGDDSCLVQLGLLRRVGKGRGARYVPGAAP